MINQFEVIVTVNNARVGLSLTQMGEDWHASLLGFPEKWDCGKTVEEAISKWVVTHSGRNKSTERK